MFSSLNKKQIIAAVCFIIGKFTGILAAATVVSSIFSQNIYSLAVILTSLAAILIGVSIILAIIDFYKQGLNKENKVDEILKDPKLVRKIQERLRNEDHAAD